MRFIQVISAMNQFSRFAELARELARASQLTSYCTSRGTFKGITDDNVKWLERQGKLKSCFSYPCFSRILGANIVSALVSFEKRTRILNDYFDAWAARNIDPDADSVIVQSHVALRTLRRAHKEGKVAILDRTNSHIAHQKDVLAEEYERLGVPLGWPSSMSDDFLERSELEYVAADKIFVLSSFVKKTFLKRGVPEKKVKIVSSGVNTRLFSPQKRVSEKRKMRVLFCGTACIKKGTHYLIDAFQRFQQDEAELLFVGHVQEGYIQKMLDECNDSRIKHIPYCPRSEMSHYYNSCDVLVLPSLEEGLPKVVLEAMACGVPVIVTPNAGGEDLVADGKDGYIVPICDVDSIVEKLHCIYENRENARLMGENARIKAVEKYSLEAYVSRVMEAVESVKCEL